MEALTDFLDLVIKLMAIQFSHIHVLFHIFLYQTSHKPPSDHSGTSIEMHPWNKILQSPPLLWDATEMAASTTA